MTGKAFKEFRWCDKYDANRIAYLHWGPSTVLQPFYIPLRGWTLSYTNNTLLAAAFWLGFCKEKLWLYIRGYSLSIASSLSLAGIGCNSYLLIFLSLLWFCPHSMLVSVPCPCYFEFKSGMLFSEMLCVISSDFLKSSPTVYSLCWTHQFLKRTRYQFPVRIVEAANM